MASEIKIRGAREHNLRDVDLTLPRGELICFTGVSGSGKSSMAFDTLFAEGQRRYVESLSHHARQFIGQMPKPDVDLVSGLSPSISISQKSTGKNPRSTVGTITEIHDFLRVLFARVGTGHCPRCGSPISAQTRDAIVGRLMSVDGGATMWVLAPLARSQKGEFRDLFHELRQQGFSRVRVDGATVRLAEPPPLDRSRRHDVEVVVDRIPPDRRDRGRVAEAVDTALRLGGQTLSLSVTPADARDAGATADDRLFSASHACARCGISFRPPTPQLFSFNGPQGMCEACDGLGELYTFLPERLVPDGSLSVRAGAVPLLGRWGDLARYRRQAYAAVAGDAERALGLSPGAMLDSAWRDLPDQARHVWLWGNAGAARLPRAPSAGGPPRVGEFPGWIPELLATYRSTRSKTKLSQLEKYMATSVCPDCHGGRLNAQAASVRIATAHPEFSAQAARSLPELCDLPIERLAAFFRDLSLTATDALVAAEAVKEIRKRLGFLLGVGLGYLTLGRTAPTLSGGESQRIRLAGQIGSALVGVLYILDEPSIGLHPRDNDRLIETLLRLRDLGNTLIVVEHDEDTIRASDRIVDFGPGAGKRGGRVMAQGTVDEIAAAEASLTGQFLAGKRSIRIRATPRSTDAAPRLVVRGARLNNLRGIDVPIPLGVVTCVTGVSGSGKSSLIGGILEPALRRALNGAECEPGPHDTIEGLEHLDKTIAIDQSPIGRTPRSNPATYVKVFDEIRRLFARLPEAKTRGYSAGRFSFNVDGGRCAHCGGNGATKLDMDFLADVWVGCPVCQGRRYNRETLTVTFKGHSVSDVLQLEVAQAAKLFENIPKIKEKLDTLVDVGLGYLKLGQPSPTLSGGEAQRIKLSRELSKRDTGRTLYVLDEPTTGLHFADIELLLKVIHGLADRGNTIIIVEHNLDVVRSADWVIDLGPEGGESGGGLVAAGTPEVIAATPGSHTGAALARALGGHAADHPPGAERTEPPVTFDPRVRTHVVVEGASEHNLKAINAQLPRDRMTVFCGPSGSGKSSLAIDTIYAEGQRRYVESLSSYARQFIGQVQKPKVDLVEGLSPSIALEQKNLGHSPRSTVGTVTEIYDYLRILMSRLGTMHCPDCGVPVGTQTPDQIIDKVLSLPPGTKALVLAPIDVQAGEKSLDTWQSLRSNGFQRVRVNGKTISLEDAGELDTRRPNQVQVVVDRVVIDPDDRARVSDSVEQALSLAVGVIELAIADEATDEVAWRVVRHSQHLVCGDCGRSFVPATAHHFSFNSALGWCPQCEGLGTQTGTNPAALVGSPRATLAEGAALLWPDVAHNVSRWMMKALARQTGLSIDTPFEEIPITQRRILFHGLGNQWVEVRRQDAAPEPTPETRADGVVGGVGPSRGTDGTDGKTRGGPGVLFRFRFKGFYPALEQAARFNPSLRAKLSTFVDEIDCTACSGARLREESASVRFRGWTIPDLVHLPLKRLAEEVSRWKLDSRQRRIAGEVIRELRSRVHFLLDVGLEYLTLHRGAATLSGGEAQRIRLAAQLGSGLCGVLYVLDEPTVGLHPRDNDRLIGALHRLRDQGNTLLVVEHDRDVIAASDHLCDFGPAAGRHGGRIVAEGPPDKITPAERSPTAAFLSGDRRIPIPPVRRPVYSPAGTPMVEFLKLQGCRENNLQGIDVEFPLGVFTVITGPSGSGKSSLVDDILYPAVARKFYRISTRPGRFDGIEGLNHLDKVIRVDQSPLGNSPNSNPATYTGAFDSIRQIFAELPEARERRYSARTFSSNVDGGRCETCEGSGQRRIAMHFLPDVWVTCETCHGRRYREDVLDVRYLGYSIADVLDMSCGEAESLFSDYPRVARIFHTLCDVGLDYVTLGQSAPTLSGGEAQRVKLATELARAATGNTLYLLDEPTTGLHFEDIAKLLGVLQQLVERGNTLIVVEHNLDVIKTADWVIDIGPGAGGEGGRLVFAGTPEGLASRAAAEGPSRPVGSRRADKKAAAPADANDGGGPLTSATAPYLARVLRDA